MKIAIIGQKGIPSISGGVEKHVEDLSTRLVLAGHEVLVYTRPNYTSPKLKTHQGVKLISLPSIKTKHLDAISHTFKACLDVSKRNVDIIHFHSIGPSSLIWLAKLLNPRTPIVTTFHSQCYKHQKWGLFAKLCLRAGEFVACKFADKTMAVSRTLRNYAIKKYASNAIYVPNGVAVQNQVPALDIKKMGLVKDGYILAVSRIVKHKGLQHLIRAYQDLDTDKKLVITGEGAHTDKFVKELKQLALNNPNIIFTGRQSGRTLAELFSNAYLFVQPSENEGLSIALLEAMSYGKATLVSDIAPNVEAIGPTGFTFRNKDITDIRNKLTTLLKSQEVVENMGVLQQERVAKEYNWQDIVAKTEKVYKNALLNAVATTRVGFRLKLANKLMNILF